MGGHLKGLSQLSSMSLLNESVKVVSGRSEGLTLFLLRFFFFFLNLFLTLRLDLTLGGRLVLGLGVVVVVVVEDTNSSISSMYSGSSSS